jgi:hypothetical protein
MFDLKSMLAVTALVAVGEGALPPAADVYAAGYKAAHYYVGQCACTPCHTTHLPHHALLLHASCMCEFGHHVQMATVHNLHVWHTHSLTRRVLTYGWHDDVFIVAEADVSEPQ